MYVYLGQHSTPRYSPKRNKNLGSYKININYMMFIAILFIIDKNWAQSKCSSTSECIKLDIQTMDYYFVIKRDKLMIHIMT